MSTTLIKNSQWFDENAVDLDFIRAHEDTTPIPVMHKVRRVDDFGCEVIDENGNPVIDLVEGHTIHKPISSVEILTKFREKAKSLGLRLVNEKGALKRNGRQFMYLADVENTMNPDYTLAVGFRNYSDKSLSFSGACAAHILCCQNGVLTGIVKPSKMRHTFGNVDAGLLDGKIDAIFSRFEEDSVAVHRQIELMRSTPLTDEIVGRFVKGVNGHWENRPEGPKFVKNPLIGSTNLCRILEELENPSLNSRGDTSVFRLHNAATYVTTHKMAPRNPAQAMMASRALNNLIMGLIQPDFVPLGDDVEVEVVEE